MKIPIVGTVIDERFLNHRLKSTSLAGIIGGITAICLFAYRFYINHVWSWDLFVVVMTILGVKLTVMAWYRITD
ncbi:MAG TPA: hypothetical protein VK706_08760 [Candidatus Sulfotelmatobacter sp.]|jgi:hypothetical protein|nr:hypothetical protein [Candidatus Sulfotelmatobacter sp.]